MIDWLIEHYNWQAMLVHLLGLVILTKITWRIAFSVPAIRDMREWNAREDKPKKAIPKYRPIIKANAKIGLYLHLVFFLLLVPFVITFEAQPWWKYLTDALLIILVYDFLYYLMHRFLFHGPILKRVHGLHHQCRDISFIDSRYVHPVETFMGSALFFATAVGLPAVLGDFHVASFIAAQFVWNNVNQINHTKFNLDYFPYKAVDYLTTMHAKHHIDMNHGNYSTLSPLYDWMFGTLEK